VADIEVASTRNNRVKFSKLIEQSVRHRLFAVIQELTTVGADGQLSWAGFHGIDEYVSVLRDGFEFPSAMSRRECSLAVWRGTLDALKTGKLEDASILAALQRITDGRLAERPQNFSMWCRLRFRPSAGRKLQFSYDGVSITLAAGLPRYMQISEDDLRKLSPIATKDKPGFGVLIARTSARNPIEAADKLFAAAEAFQAVFNLALKSWNLMGSEQKPEATLLTGPYQFLFRGKTSLLDEAMWFTPEFRDEFWHFGTINFDKLVERASTLRKALAKLEIHPLKEPLTAAFLMMNDGMESADMTRRTLRYWTALERIFQADDERASYDKIIRRATYLNEPADLERAKLARLMRIRNRYVHMGVTENEHHQLTQYVANEVRSHLFYLLFNGDDFADHAEFIEMTDLPSSSAALERRRRALDRRERMMQKRRHRLD
jgi:hypothetical protein